MTCQCVLWIVVIGILGLFAGANFGVFIMCLFQVNRP